MLKNIFNRKTMAVLKRELKEKLFSKTFVLMTLLIPVLMFGLIGIQTLLMTYGGDDHTSIQVVSDSDKILSAVKKHLDAEKSLQESHYSINYKTMDKESFRKYLDESKSGILQDKLTGIVYLGSDALKDKKAEYYSKNPNNNVLFGKLKAPVNNALVGIYFENKDMNPSDLKYASSSLEITGFRVSEKEKIEAEGYGNLIVSFLFTFLLYMSLLFLGAMMLRSVVEEKNNRIVELLLSSVNPTELMAGKIIGTSVTGLMQMIIWLSPVFLVVSSTVFVLPQELLMKISVGQISYFLFNFFIGLVTFTGLFAMIGSIFDNEQDAQSGQWPVMMLIIIPFFISLSLQNNPDTIIAKISSLFPFASIMVMPARMALVEVPMWQMALSVIINILTMFMVMIAAGKIYRVGILITGKKPKMSEIVNWLKYKY